MGNMLDFFKGPKTGNDPRKNSVSVYSVGPVTRPMMQRTAPQSAHLPRAVAVYAVAAAVFAVLTVFYLFKGMWVTGLIMIVPTCCLAGFAWYYMKASATKPW